MTKREGGSEGERDQQGLQEFEEGIDNACQKMVLLESCAPEDILENQQSLSTSIVYKLKGNSVKESHPHIYTWYIHTHKHVCVHIYVIVGVSTHTYIHTYTRLYIPIHIHINIESKRCLKPRTEYLSIDPSFIYMYRCKQTQSLTLAGYVEAHTFPHNI